jgi:hypothetical protein
MVITKVKFSKKEDKTRNKLQELLEKLWKIDSGDAISWSFNIEVGDEFPAKYAKKQLKDFYDFEVLEGEPVVKILYRHPTKKQIKEAEKWRKSLSKKEQQFVQIILDKERMDEAENYNPDFDD